MPRPPAPTAFDALSFFVVFFSSFFCFVLFFVVFWGFFFQNYFCIVSSSHSSTFWHETSPYHSSYIEINRISF